MRNAVLLACEGDDLALDVVDMCLYAELYCSDRLVQCCRGQRT